jgi:hypothetical protein
MSSNIDISKILTDIRAREQIHSNSPEIGNDADQFV